MERYSFQTSVKAQSKIAIVWQHGIPNRDRPVFYDIQIYRRAGTRSFAKASALALARLGWLASLLRQCQGYRGITGRIMWEGYPAEWCTVCWAISRRESMPKAAPVF